MVSKKSGSEFVHILRQNYAEMVKQDKLMHDHERRLPTEQEKERGQFTNVVISGVEQAFFEDFQLQRETYLTRFAEKYCFYLYGFDAVHGSRNDFAILNSTPVEMKVDGAVLNTLDATQNDVLAVLQAAKQHDVPYWSGKIRLCQDRIETTAQVLLYYFPSTDGEETMPIPAAAALRHRKSEHAAEEHTEQPVGSHGAVSHSTGSTIAPRGEGVPLGERRCGLLTFWQDLFLDQELISSEHLNRLPWMRAPSKAKSAVPLRCYDRVKGFLFLDDAFKPTSHKTMIAPKDHAFGLLVRGGDSLADKYKSLGEELGRSLLQWHESHDDEEKYEGEARLIGAEMHWPQCYCTGQLFKTGDKVYFQLHKRHPNAD